MKNMKSAGRPQLILLAAMLAAIGSVSAQEAAPKKPYVPEVLNEEMTGYMRPDYGWVSVGLGAVAGSLDDRAFFGQYTGWLERQIENPVLSGTYQSNLLLDVGYLSRDEASGLWFRFDARNLGQNNREFAVAFGPQGDWNASFTHDELVRVSPRALNSGIQGVGTATPSFTKLTTPGGGVSQRFELTRKSDALSFDKWIMPGLQFEAAWKSENKDGVRLAGLGNYCSDIISGYSCASTQGAVLLLAVPVHSNTQQFDFGLNWSGERHLVSAGYYGSIYRAQSSAVTPSVEFASSALRGYLEQPYALEPDNLAHQFYLRGNYAWTASTQSTFNFSKTIAKQHEVFSTAAPSASLGGEMETLLAQAGVSSRIVPGLTLRANVRYEDQDDRTPEVLYGQSTNSRNSFQKAAAKTDASFLAPDQLRITFGLNYDMMDRSLPVASTQIPANSLTALRQWTEEFGFNAEVRRPFGQTVSAAAGWSLVEREGSRWIQPGATKTSSDAAISAASNGVGVFPSTLMDRTREKFRVSVDWNPADKLNLQFLLEEGKDSYSAPTTKGLHDTKASTMGLDASWAIDESWKVNGFFTQGAQGLNLAHGVGYIAQLDNTTRQFGVGGSGKLKGGIEIGGEISYLMDRTEYELGSGNATAASVLPETRFSQTIFKAYGKYALDKNSDVRVDLAHHELRMNEWTWGADGVPFTYSDNASVMLQPEQKLISVSVKYLYRFK